MQLASKSLMDWERLFVEFKGSVEKMASEQKWVARLREDNDRLRKQ